jgi:hypothetical protein
MVRWRRLLELFFIYIGLILIIRGVILDAIGNDGVTWQAVVGAVMFGTSLAFYVEDDDR